MLSLRRYRWLLVSVVVAAGLVGIGYGRYRHTYPYGRSHCCDKQLYFALRDYAEMQGGAFPAGEKTPETSLSLIHATFEYGYAHLLAGKTGSEAVAQKILDSGRLLGPETCGWHYVEGLTLADDGKLALFWDKEGLGHNGERLLQGGHIVMFVTGFSEYIPKDEWSGFLDHQKALRAARSFRAKNHIPILSAKVRLPSGEVVDQYDAPFSISEESRTGSERSSGPRLVPSVLQWWQLSEFPLGGYRGEVILSLTLDGMKSKPVRVELSDGKLLPDTVIFDLTSQNSEQQQGPASPDQLR